MCQELTVDIECALKWRDKGALLIDVRSPAEYAETTVPGAINVPLFDNEERHRVGLCYKQQGNAAARRMGVELVSPKIPSIINQVAPLQEERRVPVVVFCWRGGMRSRAMTQFLDLAGIPARQLIGGHKAFRSHVLDFFEKRAWGRLYVLRGLTGVGKTHLLHQLQREGYPILDLEGIAVHRGSAFGALGLEPQPGQKMFEALLWDKMRMIGPDSWALTEGESRNIGRLTLPMKVYQSLQEEMTLWINASLTYRSKVILDDYPARDELKETFVTPIKNLKSRLGGAVVDEMLALLEGGQWDTLARELMVRYYDPLYNHTKPERRIEIDMEPEEAGLQRLKEAIATLVESD